MAEKQQLEWFYKLSAALTGFPAIDLQGTGVGPEYLDALVRGGGTSNVEALLEAVESGGDAAAASIWNDDRFGALARNIVLMWYLGSWYPLTEEWHRNHPSDVTAPVPEHVVSTAAYKEGLVWPAMGTHPPSAKPPGFAHWADPPG